MEKNNAPQSKVQGLNRRFLKQIKDLNEVDLGRSNFDKETFFKLFKKISNSETNAPFQLKYYKLIELIESFLQFDIRHNLEPLNKTTILELMYFYIQSLIPFSEQETKNRSNDKKRLNAPATFLDNTNHIHGKIHYIQELYFYLCYGPNIDINNLEKNTLKISPKFARETIAKWTILFDASPNLTLETEEELIIKRSEAIQKASKRWNVRQVPNKKRGVYLGKIEIIEEVINGNATKMKKQVVLVDEESLNKYRPKYPKFTSPSQRPDANT